MLKDRLRNKRLELQMSLEEVAKLVDVSRQTIFRYETGVISNVPSDKIERLARALNTTPEYLMGWTAEAKAEEAWMSPTVQTSDEAELLRRYRQVPESRRSSALDYVAYLGTQSQVM